MMKVLKQGCTVALVQSMMNQSMKWVIYCLDKNTGTLLWQKVAYKGVPKQKRHPKSSHANSTMATDGNYVVAFFGSEGLYCYDMDGNLQWQKDFGVLRSVFFVAEDAEWEFATSPIIHDGSVIIQCDVMENSFVASYDVASGKEIWSEERDEYPGWCTPNIYYDGDQCRVVLNGYKHRGAYDFKNRRGDLENVRRWGYPGFLPRSSMMTWYISIAPMVPSHPSMLFM